MLSGLLYGKSSWILQMILVHKIINTVTKVSTRTFFCIRGLDNPRTFYQCFSYFEISNFWVGLNDEFDL